MKHRLSKLLIGVSLGLCISISLLSLSSFRVGYSVSYMPQDPTFRPFDIEGHQGWGQIGWITNYNLTICRGRIIGDTGFSDGRVKRWEFETFDPRTEHIDAGRFGFAFKRDTFVIPIWSIAAILAFASSVLIASRSRTASRARRSGHAR